MNSQKIFVSGVAGFLGSHLAQALVAQGHHVIGADNLSTGDLANIPEGVEFHEYDLADLEMNQKLTRNVDVVYHAAALAYDGFSVFSPLLVAQNVYVTSVALMSAAAENQVKRFVYCSSMSRYGQQPSPFTEDMLGSPVTPYGIAKYSAELTLNNLAKTHGIESVICIPHNIFGTKQKYDDPYRNVVAIMMNRMLQGEQPVIYGDGSHRRCFSYIKDCLPVLVELGFSENAKNEVFNIGPDEQEVSILELAGCVAKELNFNLDPIFLEARPNEVPTANCSADKIRNYFGYKTEFSLEQAVSEMAEWMFAAGPKPFKYTYRPEIKNESIPKTWLEEIL